MAAGAPVLTGCSRTRAGCLGLCPAVASEPPRAGSVFHPPTNFLHVSAAHNTSQSHGLMTTAIKMTFQNSLLSLLLLSLPKGFPSSGKHLPPWLQEFCSWDLHIRVLRSAFYLEMQSHSHFSRSPAEPEGWALPAGNREKAANKKDGGSKEKRLLCVTFDHQTTSRHLKTLGGFRVISSSPSVLCSAFSLQMKSSAEDGDASGRDFSNWGGGEEAASGERGRKRSLYKAAKFKNIRREKCKRERAKLRKFWNCQVHYRSELRPSQTLNQHSSHGSNPKPSKMCPSRHLYQTYKGIFRPPWHNPEVSWGLKFKKNVWRTGVNTELQDNALCVSSEVPGSTTTSAFQTAPKELKHHPIFQHGFQKHKTGQRLNCESW